MSSRKKFLGHTIIYGASTVISRLLNFFLTPLYLAVLNESADFGVMSYFFSIAGFVAVLVSYGFETAFFRYIHKERDKPVAGTAFLSLLFSSLIFLIIGAFWYPELATMLDRAEFSDYLLLIIIILGIDTISTIPFAILRAQERPLRYGMIKTVNVVINVAFNLFFFLACPWLIKNGYGDSFISTWYDSNWLVGYAFLSNIFASLISLILLVPQIVKINFKFDFNLWKKMMLFAWPIAIGGLAYVTNEMSDRLFLSYLLPKEIADSELGIYSAVYKMAIIMNIIIQGYRFGAEPFFYKMAAQKNAKEQYAWMMKVMVMVLGFAFLVVAQYMELFKWVFLRKEEYFVGLKVVPILLLAILFSGMYYNLSVWYKVTDRTKFGAYFSILGALVTIAINWIYIPKYGYMASAWATLACYFTMLIVSYLFSRNFYRIPYDYKRILTYIFGALGLYLFSSLLEDQYYIVSTISVLIYIGLIYILEKETFHKFITAVCKRSK